MLYLIDKVNVLLNYEQCCGSMAFCCGSGSESADPCIWLMDPDPFIFIINLQDATNFLKVFCLLLFKGTFTSIFKEKANRSHRTVGKKVFLIMFAWWLKDRDPGPCIWLEDPNPGGPKKYGSESATLIMRHLIHTFRSSTINEWMKEISVYCM